MVMANWRERSACRNIDHTEANKFVIPSEFDYVKEAYCNNCPVRLSCLEEALRCYWMTESHSGIAGGLTPRERVLLMAKRSRGRPLDTRDPILKQVV